MSKEQIAAVCLGVKVPKGEYVTASEARRMAAGNYEGAEIRGALHVVRDGDVVLELGAGIGLVGAVIARNRAVRHVYAFEANPDLMRACRWLYRLNRLRKRMTLRNEVMVSAPERPATLPFYRDAAFRSSSLLASDRAQSVVDVPTADFNAFCLEFGPDVLVADIEGGELELLRYADLSGFRAVVIEFHGNRYGRVGLDACKAILLAAGFKKVKEKSTPRVWTLERGDSVQVAEKNFAHRN
ncbi:MAG: FkbM family methyltransferase [Arenibacterium sp.]